MYSIAFDTTGSGCSIALLHKDKIIASFSESMDFGQAEVLMPQIKKMLDSENLKFSQIDNLFVCAGPGSFTGVRSGISAARVFGVAQPKLKVCGVSAFDAYAQMIEIQDIAEANAIIIETRRDDFYFQMFDKKMNKQGEPKAMTRGDIINILKTKGCLVTLAGDGVERFLSQPSGLSLHSIKMTNNLPIEALCKAGLKMLQSKKINYPKPLYLRAPDVTLPKL